jgi:tetratricopeptide (TPR) repeat protein
LSKSNPVDWQTGITYLQQAIDQNPADAYAYAALAEGYVMIGHGPSPSRDVFPKAREAALRAIQLDSTLADGWAALAHYETYFGWNWERAERAFEKANQLNPNLAMNHYHRSWYLILFGRKEEAIKEHLLAKQLDPFNALIVANTGLLYAWLGEYDKAIAEVNESMSSPGFSEWAWGLSAKATISADLGRYDEALDLSKQASEAFPIWRYLTYGPILIKSGRIEEGSQIVAELEQQPITPFGSLCLGFMHALLGDADNSLKWLSLPEKHGWYPWIRVWPGMGLENLYDDPRFLKLFEEMNLPAYPQKLRNDQLETGQLVE